MKPDQKYLLIGPSGIGKSSAIKCLENDDSLSIADLDYLLASHVKTNSISSYFNQFGNQNFFDRSKEVIESITGTKPILIAVGAGSFDWQGSHQWYAGQNTIALIGDPVKIYPRCGRQHFHTTLQGYINQEFAGARGKLYANCKYQIDVTDLSYQEVAIRIKEIILS